MSKSILVITLAVLVILGATAFMTYKSVLPRPGPEGGEAVREEQPVGTVPEVPEAPQIPFRPPPEPVKSPPEVPQQPIAQPKPPTTPSESMIDTSNWKTYRNEKYGFEVKYPSNFTLERRGSSDSEITIEESINNSWGLRVIFQVLEKSFQELLSNTCFETDWKRGGMLLKSLAARNLKACFEWVGNPPWNYYVVYIQMDSQTILKATALIADEWRLGMGTEMVPSISQLNLYKGILSSIKILKESD